jgi:hypothetical protein
MDGKLTEYGRYSMQNSQLLTKVHCELDDKSIAVLAFPLTFVMML